MKHGSYNCVDEKKMKDVNLTWFPGVLPAREKYKLAQTRATNTNNKNELHLAN